MKALKVFLLLVGLSFAARAEVNFKKIFSDRDACFLISDIQSGKVFAEFNRKRCEVRYSPYSTFKIPAAIMAFEKGILKSENQVIKWDGIKRGRKEIDQNMTPFTWISESAKWVTEWIMPQLGMDQINTFLNKFEYGNKDFSGGYQEAWVSSSLKISAEEQIHFLSQFWNNKLGLSEQTIDKTKKIIFIKKLGKSAELYGKTGTGCLVGHACLDQPDKMFGWFVGYLKTEKNIYAFAGNASDLKIQKSAAGPRMRTATIEILKQLGLTPE